MQRREFIKLSAQTALLLALSGVNSPLYADTLTTTSKMVINVMLNGGPDFRHLIVPAYNDDTTSYGYNFWKARSTIFGKSTPADLKQAYIDNYDEITISGVVCGILKKAGWLKNEIIAGNVAIVNNVIASPNRNHNHSQLILENGFLDAKAFNHDVSGWEGRASKELNAKVVSVTSEPKIICNSPHPTNPLSHSNSQLVSNYDSRNFGLYSYSGTSTTSESSMMSRALSGYYQEKSNHISSTSIYRKSIEYEETLRQFGSLVKERLDTTPIPVSISNLLKGNTNQLSSVDFAKQIASIYDSYATQDIFSMRFASMEYTGWDSHKNLRTQIEPHFEDMFGTGKGFDSLISELKTLRADSYDNSVIVISGEFGRQLLGNGAGGNDHGKGNSVLVIGGKVKGGFYGNPFPDYEINNLNIKNKDIEGKTSMFRVYGAIVDWQQSGLAQSVFGDLSSHILEDGVDLSTMIEA